MEDIILSLEPILNRLEKFLLWKNRYISLIALTFAHGIFYGIARIGLRPFCALTIVLFFFHLLDCFLKRKKSETNDENDCSHLTQLVLNGYRWLCKIQENLQTIKSQNRMKYSLIIINICLLCAYTGMKINGFYIAYLLMLIGFILPAIVYHKIIPKLLRRIAPIIEQLDQSMEYKRRTLVDRKDLLVKIKTPGLNEIDIDDENLEKYDVNQEESSMQDDISIINSDNNDEISENLSASSSSVTTDD